MPCLRMVDLWNSRNIYISALQRWRRHVGAGVAFHEQRLWTYRSVRSGEVEYVSMHERLVVKAMIIRALRERKVETVGPGHWKFP